VYTTMTGEKDVADRLLRLIAKRGFRCEVLRSTVELKKREEWIAKHGPRNQVIISLVGVVASRTTRTLVRTSFRDARHR
jgi:hypothetical protein